MKVPEAHTLIDRDTGTVVNITPGMKQAAEVFVRRVRLQPNFSVRAKEDQGKYEYSFTATPETFNWHIGYVEAMTTILSNDQWDALVRYEMMKRGLVPFDASFFPETSTGERS